LTSAPPWTLRSLLVKPLTAAQSRVSPRNPRQIEGRSRLINKGGRQDARIMPDAGQEQRRKAEEYGKRREQPGVGEMPASNFAHVLMGASFTEKRRKALRPDCQALHGEVQAEIAALSC
jgi:hypothetical protein